MHKTMHADQWRKLRRLILWYLLNSILFTACYLNYRLQLKHRYLYKTLSVGLCFSRAAAMVINFNLLLVWLPMCKYTLTRLAYLANKSRRRQRSVCPSIGLPSQQAQSKPVNKNQLMISTITINSNNNNDNHIFTPKEAPQIAHLSTGKVDLQIVESQNFKHTSIDLNAADEVSKNKSSQGATCTLHKRSLEGSSSDNNKQSRRILLLMQKISSISSPLVASLNRWLNLVKQNSISSFLIAIDYCTSLHTICATTITIASIIHTVAHLMNVINFSKHYDPLLGNLNMADSRGQNPFELFVSVPGITGLLMIVILLLMSLSSINIIRNSSFHLFQIFHRLSIIFVILLILHPSSHVLKEQSNVDRHHPEICYERLVKFAGSLNVTASGLPVEQRPKISSLDSLALRARLSRWQTNRAGQVSLASNQNAPNCTGCVETAPRLRRFDQRIATTTTGDITDPKRYDLKEQKQWLQRQQQQQQQQQQQPTLDRKRRRRQAFELRDDACLDLRPKFVAQSSVCWYALGLGLSMYIIDLILRRSRRARSSIELVDVGTDCEGNLLELILSNNHKRFSDWLPGQFVYLNCPQIAKLEWHPFTISSMDNSERLFTLHIKTGGDWTRELRNKLELIKQQSSAQQSYDLVSVNNNLQQWTKSIEILNQDDHPCSEFSLGLEQKSSCCLYIGNSNNSDNNNKKSISGNLPIELFVDGPFHSPFERLIEQQVSICISNGVGWTAFSSVFQCLTERIDIALASMQTTSDNNFWSKWRHFSSGVKPIQEQNNRRELLRSYLNSLRSSKRTIVDTKVHLMVIVTTLDQLRPFYDITLKYFDRLNKDYDIGVDDELNPIKEVSAYLTRASSEDLNVNEFIERNNFTVQHKGCQFVQINGVFNIYLSKPDLNAYLESFSNQYSNRQKISVYCCGSYNVKKTVKQMCRLLNKSQSSIKKELPTYSYHEENF